MGKRERVEQAGRGRGQRRRIFRIKRRRHGSKYYHAEPHDGFRDDLSKQKATKKLLRKTGHPGPGGIRLQSQEAEVQEVAGTPSASVIFHPRLVEFQPTAPQSEDPKPNGSRGNPGGPGFFSRSFVNGR